VNTIRDRDNTVDGICKICTSITETVWGIGIRLWKLVNKNLEDILFDSEAQALTEPEQAIVSYSSYVHIRPSLRESWRRSDEYVKDGANPLSERLTGVELDQLLRNNLTLSKATRHHVYSLFQSMKELDYTVLLCDHDGWLIDMMGNLGHIHKLECTGVVKGIRLREQNIGNSAISSALMTRRSTYVQSYEHYLPELRDWSAAAAPIITNGERLVGAISFVTSRPTIDAYLPSLVQSASIAIGNWLQLEEYRQDIARVQQSLISHLDYDVILINANGKIIEERHPIPLPDPIRHDMRDLALTAAEGTQEVSLTHRVYAVDVRNLQDHTGQNRGKLVVFHDVTQHKKFELRIRDTEKLSILTSLSAGIAHEIRNPLTTARGFLQLFLERLTSPEDRRFLNLTIAELDRIQRLVKDFMSLAKPEDVNYESVNIQAIVGEITDFMQAEASLRGVWFHSQLPAGNEVWIRANVNQIKQVILNLVQNALQACTSKDSVHLQLIADHSQVRIVIQDSGCGMSPDQLDRIYQPFYTTKATGTGLGLAISRRIMEEHGGAIKVESKLGKGTSVHLQFPQVHLNRPLNSKSTGDVPTR
jgi:signal transduction histidine kinase